MDKVLAAIEGGAIADGDSRPAGKSASYERSDYILWQLESTSSNKIFSCPSPGRRHRLRKDKLELEEPRDSAIASPQKT